MNDYFTKPLSEVLKNQGYNTPSQTSELTEILSILGKFPNFNFNDMINLDFTKLFIEKYDIREICCEDEKLFLHFWREKSNELLINYLPKIDTWLKNYKDLFKFTVETHTTDSLEFGNNNKQTFYYNPINSNIEKLKVQDVNDNSNTGHNTRTIDRQRLQAIWGKTRADIMAKILEVKDIYNECIKEFEEIFLGVY